MIPDLPAFFLLRGENELVAKSENYCHSISMIKGKKPYTASPYKERDVKGTENELERK